MLWNACYDKITIVVKMMVEMKPSARLPCVWIVAFFRAITSTIALKLGDCELEFMPPYTENDIRCGDREDVCDPDSRRHY